MHGGKELVFAGQAPIDKDQLKGSINEIAGRAKRQVGEWTGDTDAQIEGLAQEVKGKAQKAWGGIKKAARTAQDDVRTVQEKGMGIHSDAPRTNDPQAARRIERQ